MEERKSHIQKGQIAPDFTLKDHSGKEFKLSDFTGKRVLLSFHPLAWTPVCAKQMLSLETNMDTFESMNTIVVGVSVDTIPSKKAWAENLGMKRTRLLSDFWPHGNVAKLYGIFREQGGTSERANIIVDEKGETAFVKVYEISQLPDIQEIIGVIKGL